MGDTLTLDLDVPEAVKTAECPRLSPSIAKILVGRSPLHAYHAHRLLGGGDGGESTKAQDTGKILEALVFGAPMDSFAIIQADSFRGKEAQAARDEAREAGKTPVLAHEFGQLVAGAGIIKERLQAQGIRFNGGEYQKHVEWVCTVTGAECHGYLDYYQDGVIFDLKTTTDASPRKVQRQFVEMGYDIQGAAYRDGIETMIPALLGRSRMIFIYAETEAPFAVQLYEAAGSMRDLGDNKWHEAKRQWVNCMENDYWPSYFSGTGQLEALPWQVDFAAEIEVTA